MSEYLPYQRFTNAVEREMIAECGFRVAEYLHEEHIGSLVLVDQAARNIHIPVRNAWGIEYPDEPKPTVYFLNPDGFLSPDTHEERDYTNMVTKMMVQKTGLSATKLLIMAELDPALAESIREKGRDVRVSDHLIDRRQQINEEMTKLATKAIPRDPRFNGRVLILDACRHTGTSQDGIARALEDIGVVDVRTGVVNGIKDRSDGPDFVVFEDYEIEDICKPFGTQEGLGRSRDMITPTTLRGLTHEARLARKELHRMRHEFPELRQTFQRRSAGAREIAALPPDAQQFLKKVFGNATVLNVIGGGLIVPDLSRGAEYGAADAVDEYVDRPEQ